MASFESSVQVRPGATFQRTMGPTSASVSGAVGATQCPASGTIVICLAPNACANFTGMNLSLSPHTTRHGNDDGIVVRARLKLLKRINVICPVQSHLQKYFASPVGQIISTNSRHPVPHREAYRDRHERGMGCGGRGSVLRAMGSQGGFFESVSDHQASGREMLQRTAKSCGPDAPTLASSSRSLSRPNRA
jgi:hypothetical protein